MTKEMSQNSIQKILLNHRFQVLVSVIIAIVIATTVTIDQQSKNLIKLLVATGVFATIFNWRALKIHAGEIDKTLYLIIGLFYLSVLISILINPTNRNTYHELQILSISIGSLFIYNLLIIIRFRAAYFWWGITLCAISSGVYALAELAMYGIEHRAVGSSNKWIMFGDIALISGLISTAAITYFRQYNYPLKYIPYLAVLLGLTASLLSQTRGGWIFLPLAIIIIFLYKRNKSKNFISWKKLIVASVVFLISISILVNSLFLDRLTKAYTEIHQYLTSQSEEAGRTSIGQRFEMWRAATLAFKESPVIGIGPGNFENHVETIAAENKVNKLIANAIPHKGGKHTPHSHAHNEYMNTLATRGVFGLISILLLFVIPLYKFYTYRNNKNQRISDIGLAGNLLISGVMVFALSESILSHDITINFFLLTLTILFYLAKKQEIQSN